MDELEDKVVKETEAARLLSISPSLLRKWRHFGGGPKYTKLGGTSVRYRMSDLVRFVDEAAAMTVHRQAKEVQK